jgi:hypothetical protein
VSSDFVLANGDVTMASFHTDYIAGSTRGARRTEVSIRTGCKLRHAGVADKPGNSGDSHQNDAEESRYSTANRFFFV